MDRPARTYVRYVRNKKGLTLCQPLRLCEEVSLLCAFALYLDIAHADTFNLLDECRSLLCGNFHFLCEFACEFRLRSEKRSNLLDEWCVFLLCLGRCGRPLCVACIEFSDCFRCESFEFLILCVCDYCCVEFSLCHFSFLSPFGECRLSICCSLLCLYCIRFLLICQYLFLFFLCFSVKGNVLNSSVLGFEPIWDFGCHPLPYPLDNYNYNDFSKKVNCFFVRNTYEKRFNKNAVTFYDRIFFILVVFKSKNLDPINFAYDLLN